MIRQFISVMPNGDVKRHEEVPLHLISEAAAILEICPTSATAVVRIFSIDEDGYKMEEIK